MFGGFLSTHTRVPSAWVWYLLKGIWKFKI
jgi:hypothetical protein